MLFVTKILRIHDLYSLWDLRIIYVNWLQYVSYHLRVFSIVIFIIIITIMVIIYVQVFFNDLLSGKCMAELFLIGVPENLMFLMWARIATQKAVFSMWDHCFKRYKFRSEKNSIRWITYHFFLQLSRGQFLQLTAYLTQ